jgi:sulfur-oxidizing protein SoxY
MPPITPMTDRRRFLDDAARVAALLASAGLWPIAARAQAGGMAYNTAAFAAHGPAAAYNALGMALPVESKNVLLQAQELAENGAAVPVDVSTTLTGVKRLLLLVENNPAALSAIAEVSDAVEPSFSLRIKMAESSNVYAVAITADGRAFFAKRDVKVTLGGCG